TALLDVKKMKELVREMAPKVTGDENFEQIRDQLQQASTLEQAPAAPKGDGTTELSKDSTAAVATPAEGDATKAATADANPAESAPAQAIHDDNDGKVTEVKPADAAEPEK